jgi:hypothetical protein
MVIAANAERTSARPLSQYVFKIQKPGTPRKSHEMATQRLPLKTQDDGGCRRSSHQRGSKLSLPPSHAHCVPGVGDLLFQIGQQVVPMAPEHLPTSTTGLSQLRLAAKPVFEEPPPPGIYRRKTVISLFTGILSMRVFPGHNQLISPTQ